MGWLEDWKMLEYQIWKSHRMVITSRPIIPCKVTAAKECQHITLWTENDTVTPILIHSQAFVLSFKECELEGRTMRRRLGFGGDKTERMGWTGWILEQLEPSGGWMGWIGWTGWILELPDVSGSLLRAKKDGLAYCSKNISSTDQWAPQCGGTSQVRWTIPLPCHICY